LKRFTKLQAEGRDVLRAAQLNKARTRNEGRAAMTIVLTITTYYLCYMPCILYAAYAKNQEDMTSTSEEKLFGFAANYFLFFSSACNPFIYVIRTSRFRLAVKHSLLKSPFGSEDFSSLKHNSSMSKFSSGRNRHVRVHPSTFVTDLGEDLQNQSNNTKHS
jgi:hypothetical protein